MMKTKDYSFGFPIFCRLVRLPQQFETLSSLPSSLCVLFSLVDEDSWCWTCFQPTLVIYSLLEEVTSLHGVIDGFVLLCIRVLHIHCHAPFRYIMDEAISPSWTSGKGFQPAWTEPNQPVPNDSRITLCYASEKAQFCR